MSDSIDSDTLEDWLGPAPSPEQAEYLEQQNNRRLEIKELFDDWFYEMKGFGFRAEYFWGDFDYAAETKDYKRIIKWLRTAYEMGYNASEAKFYGGTNA
jgi:hypothetical protein